MTDRAFLIVAECLFETLPTSGDLKEVEQRLSSAQVEQPALRAITVRPPAVVRHGRYALITEFAVNADTKEVAEEIVRQVMRRANVPCESVYFSGRVLTEVGPPVSGPAATAGPSKTTAQPKTDKKRSSTRARRPAATGSIRRRHSSVRKK